MKKKKSDSLNSSVESEGLGLALRNRGEGKQPELRKDGLANSLTSVQTGSLVFGQTTSTNTLAKPTEQDSEIKNSSKETSEISEQSKFLSLTYLQQDFPVKVFPLLENAKVFRIEQGELFSLKSAGSLEIKDQATYSLRMLKDYFHTTTEEPLQLYSFHWMNLGIMLNGKCSTLNIGYPKIGKGSLSLVLEEKVDKKFYLSEKSLKSFIRKEIKLTKTDKISPTLKATYSKGGISKFGTTLFYEGAILSEKNKKWLENGKELSRNFPQGQRVYSSEGIASNICGDAGGLGGKTGLYKLRNKKIRRLTPRECERLLDPDAYFGEPELFMPKYDEIHISVVFTWDVQRAYWLKRQWEHIAPIKIGGVAIEGESKAEFNPGLYLKEGITITSRGCPNLCPWCFIRQPLKELEIKPGNNIIDNNILACSKSHLDKVFSMLGSQRDIHFSGGLEARLITDKIAEKLRGSRIRQMFLAYDDPSRLDDLKKAVSILSKYFSREYIRCFVLIGFKHNDTITKARDRLIEAWNIGTIPFAMLFRNCKGDYPKGSTKQWMRLQKYWARPAFIKKMAKNKFKNTLDIIDKNP